MIHRYLIRF